MNDRVHAVLDPVLGSMPSNFPYPWNELRKTPDGLLERWLRYLERFDFAAEIRGADTPESRAA